MDGKNITPLDLRIKLAGGSTTATERLPSQMQQAKANRQKTVLGQNLELIRENGRLRQEIAFHEERAVVLLRLLRRAMGVQEEFQQLLNSTSTEIDECEARLLANFGISSFKTEAAAF